MYYSNLIRISLIGMLAIMMSACSKFPEESEAVNNVFAKTNSINDMLSKYSEISNKPIISVMDILHGDQDFTRSGNATIGLTAEDAEYLNSLNETELEALRHEVYTKMGLDSNDEFEEYSIDSYNAIFADMDIEEYERFCTFVDAYIEMPEGEESLMMFDVFNENQVTNNYADLYIYAAIGIDKFGRVMYNSINSTRTKTNCKEILSKRLAIAYVSALGTALLGGPAWAVTFMAVGDVITISLDYKNCLNNHQKK